MGRLIASTQATVDGVVDPVAEWVQPDGDHGEYSFERLPRAASNSASVISPASTGFRSSTISAIERCAPCGFTRSSFCADIPPAPSSISGPGASGAGSPAAGAEPGALANWASHLDRAAAEWASATVASSASFCGLRCRRQSGTPGTCW